MSNVTNHRDMDFLLGHAAMDGKEDNVMTYFHLTWDVTTNKHAEAPSQLACLLCNKPFNVKYIGRPIESTVVFWMKEQSGDIDSLYDAIRQKFSSGFDFIISRASVSTATVAGKEEKKYYLRGAGIKAHEDGFAGIIRSLQEAGKIPNDVKNLPIKR